MKIEEILQLHIRFLKKIMSTHNNIYIYFAIAVQFVNFQKHDKERSMNWMAAKGTPECWRERAIPNPCIVM